MSARRLHLYSSTSVKIVLLLIPVLVYLALQLRIGSAAVENWLPAGRPERQVYNHFVELFGQDHFLLVSWPGCKADERLEAFAHKVRSEFAGRTELGVRAVTSTATALAELQQQSKLSLPIAKQRLKNFLIGEDDTALVLIALNEAAASHRAEIVDIITQSAVGFDPIEPNTLVIAGEPYQMLMIDQASRNAMESFVVPSMLAAVLMAWWCLRSIKLTFVVFALAGFGQLTALVLIYLVAGQLSAVMVVLPTLVFMLTLSSAVHLSNYYVDCGGDRNPEAATRALALGFKPCSFATLTTVFGFGSLIVSQLEPVWQFGSLAAMGLLLSTIVLLSVFPAAVRWPVKSVTASSRTADVQRPVEFYWFGTYLAQFANRWTAPITFAGWGLLVITGWGLTKLETSTEFVDMFAPSHPAIQQLNWVEEHIGPISSFEILVRFPLSPEADYLQRAQEVQELQHELELSPHIVAAISPTSLLPELPTGDGIRDTIRRSAMRRMLGGRIVDLINQNAIAIDDGFEYWRITARVAELKQANYATVRNDITALCQRYAEQRQASRETSSPDAMQVSLTGLRVVVEEAHRSLLTDLSSSFAMAFLLITPAMMFVVRRFWLGLLIMLPNVLPVMLVFGGMGWLGIKLDVASILTASVALGIAVDDTLHVMSWYLRARRTHSNESAIAIALQHCSRAMLHTTLISASAMLPFFFTAFEPTSKFALLMILILSAAIIGDLVLLPALLLSRFGTTLTHSLGTDRSPENGEIKSTF